MWFFVMFFFLNLLVVYWFNFDVFSFCVCVLNFLKWLIGIRFIFFVIGGFNFVLSVSK